MKHTLHMKLAFPFEERKGSIEYYKPIHWNVEENEDVDSKELAKG